jgi:uncharacterized protein (DUF302 family)
MQTKLGFTVRLNAEFGTALTEVTEALKSEGFGVLTEIDVKETMKKKLGEDYSPFKILGACNPILAHRALTIAPEVGLLLPCNVVVRQLEEGKTEVSLVDPLEMLGFVGRPELQPVAQEARVKMERVAATLQARTVGEREK